MSKLPLISIIVPVYNVEHFLPRCLDSIINQTYTNLEILCVNDGSPDNCGQILAEYAARDSRIKVIEQENRGASEARNTALDHSSGQYLMFVDADDYLAQDACSLAALTAEKENADLVFWSYLRDFGNCTKEKHFRWEDGTVFEGNQATLLHRNVCGPVGEELATPSYLHSFEPLWNKLYRSDYILNNHIRFVDIRKIGTSEDGIFNLYALRYIKKAIYIKRCLYTYNKTNDYSLTTKYKHHLSKQRKNLTAIIRDYLNENNLSDDFYEALENRVALNLIGLGLNVLSAQTSLTKKIHLLKEILLDAEHQAAYKQLKTSAMPIHWKFFFFCAKHRLSVVIYILLSCMRFAITH